MNVHREHHLDLCPGYVLDALSDTERRELDEHLAQGCEACERELRQLQAATMVIAAGVPRLRAPAAMRGRVLALVGAEMSAGSAPRTEPARPARAPLPLPRPRSPFDVRVVLPWAVAAALLAVVTVVQWQAANRAERALTASRGELARLTNQLDDERGWTALLESPQSRQVALAPTPDGTPQLTARLTFDPATHRAVLVCENFTAPTGKDYELWAIRASGPESLGLVRAGADGRAVVRLANVGDPATLGAFAVSLERAGGAPTRTAPAGPVVMLGKLGG